MASESTVDRAEILAALDLLYPHDHGIIELAVLQKDNTLLPGHFDDRGKLVDEIVKYDTRADTLAIYTGLNPIKPESFTRKDDPLRIDNSVARGSRMRGEDIARITGILFDIDPFRAHGNQKDSTTDDEHQAGIDTAIWLKNRLALMGWPEPVVGDSCNGGALRYAADLPATEKSANLIKRALEAANDILPEQFRAKVEVDPTTYDMPRVSKVFGTVSRKGSGTQERPWRRSKVISAPQTLEPVPLDSIMKLIAAGKPKEETISTPWKDGTKPLSDAKDDPNIRPCLKEIILNEKIRRLEEVSAHEHKGRVAIAVELLKAEYSWQALHEFFSRMDDYTTQATDYQLNQIVRTWISKGRKPWRCATLREKGVISSGRCEGCKRSDNPQIQTVILEDPKGTMGFSSDPMGVFVVNEYEDPKTKETKKVLSWVSDCSVFIHTETTASDETEFTFWGIGAKDRRVVKFTMPARDLADSRKFKAALINAFGAANRVGNLDFEKVQLMSKNTITMNRIEVPTWSGNIPLLPGVGLAEDVEFRLSLKTPAVVYDGDLEMAKTCLRKLLGIHKYAPILIAFAMGAPAYARWHRGDRFSLGLWGLTGSLKTTIVLLVMAMYGTGYLNEDCLLKHGKNGSTVVGMLEVFAAAGFLPQPIDNVKTVDERDVQQYIAFLHAVLEGGDKTRGAKDGGLRDSKPFNSSPIVTGEIRPEEASTTARGLNLDWIKPDDSKLSDLSHIQENVSSMPVIGYHWLRFLSETERDLIKGFSEARAKKMAMFSQRGFVNPGRLATNYILLRSTWNLMCESPFGDVFEEFTERFVSALDKAFDAQGGTVTEETELSRLLMGVRELLAGRPGLIVSKKGETLLGDVLGKWTDEGLFLLPGKVLAELSKLKFFTQKPSIDSLTKSLHSAGLLIPDKDGHLQKRIRMNGTRVRGWQLKHGAIFPADSGDISTPLSPPTGDTKNDSVGSNVPSGPAVPTKKRKNVFGSNFEEMGGLKDENRDLHENSGDTGDTGDIIDNNIVTDSDLDTTISVPSTVPTQDITGDSKIAAEIKAVEQIQAERGERFKTPSPRAAVADTTPTATATITIGEEPDPIERARGLAIAMFGMNGWVDPSEFARELKLDEEVACKILDDLGYIRYTRQGGIGFRQRRAGEAV